MEERQSYRPEPGYPPEAAGLDPVTPDFSHAVRFSPQSWPDDGVRARDEFYYHEQLSSNESFKRKHFSIFTWTMIVIAGVVLGASMALMAAGA
jgi:hypothetical protein